MELKTLTGKDLSEAFRELDRQLPKEAYKAITGGKGEKLGLTDIIPAFLPELLLELFGPAGYGWNYVIDSMDHTPKEKQITATCKIAIYYRFLRDGELVQSDPIPATGGSTNSQIEWAMKGALTNALGCAWFFAGYQLSVYKGERSHNTENMLGGGEQRQGSGSSSGSRGMSQGGASQGAGGDPLTLDQAKAEMDRQANNRDLAAWMTANRPRLKNCMKEATDHFNQRMQALKKAA